MIKNTRKGIPTYKAVAILVIAVLLTAGLTSIFYSFYKILDYREFDIRLQTTEGKQIGFNLDPGVFNFGKIPLGASAKRNATVSHEYPFDVVVRIDISGDASRMVYVENNYFILGPNMTKEVEVTASVPQGTEPGNYSGKLKVYFERP